MRRPVVLLITAASMALAAQARAVEPDEVVATYAEIGAAMYADSLASAQALDRAVDAFLSAPSKEAHEAVKAAWKAARVPYQQTEALRFGNPLVDEWEGRVNAWPLDEGLIDYVDMSYGDSSEENPLYTLNVVASPQLRVGKDVVDASEITPDLLSDQLQEALDVETNVAIGYHAVEFLLWGQDLNGTGPGAGMRPWTDYSLEQCTGGHCERRRAYLSAATDLLVTDLQEMADAWKPGGAARKDLTSVAPEAGIGRILTGIGSLSYGELAGERMKLGLLLNDPEEEHDCFSDNTHNSHYYDQVGMTALWSGSYQRLDGSVVQGPSVQALAAEKAPDLAQKVTGLMDDTTAKLGAIREAAESGRMAYDQMLAADNAEGNGMLQAAVDALVAQTRGVEEVVAALGVAITVEGSDSLDDPAAVAP
ncbi:MAG TPA: imelysin family protein [Geminicoccus sp.]|jgi:putative iron-regulated protein|uniref:imelysin family protein n=1 Tax=Geminicoccus sp. TaxID=2024832 RepID=UPI002E32C732|nr:imelysin family protein [Geminicoccus sp.]HEX2528286.1 imelysin family protein [Geminicoccus sp.]